MRCQLTAVFTPKEIGAGFIAEVPDIPHCVTSGRDLADALAEIEDAASIMLVALEDDGQPLPAASAPSDFAVPPDGAVALLSLDTDAYRARM